MKLLRKIILALGAIAAVLLGVFKFADTPFSKGSDTDFEWHVDRANNRLLFTDDAGTVTCWVLLELPARVTAFRAETSSGVRLKAYQRSLQGPMQMVAITKDSQSPETPFDWPSGSSVLIYPQDGSSAASLAVGDWHVYLANKNYDSRDRAKARKIGYGLTILFLVLAIPAVVIEALEKARGKEESREPFSAEYCLKQLINRVEGDSPEQSEQMRTLLQKVLIEGVDSRDAVAPWQMSLRMKASIQTKALRNLQNSLGLLVAELPGYLTEIAKRLPS